MRIKAVTAEATSASGSAPIVAANINSAPSDNAGWLNNSRAARSAFKDSDMADNLFREHSIADIEACVGKALSELLGKATAVRISQLKLDSGAMGIHHAAEFDVRASIDKDWGDGDFFADKPDDKPR